MSATIISPSQTNKINTNDQSSCPICYEQKDLEKLECGHQVHEKCLRKHFKQECPLCRRPHKFPVSGKLVVEQEKKSPVVRKLADIYNELRKQQRSTERSIERAIERSIERRTEIVDSENSDDGSRDLDDEDSDAIDYDL